MQAGEVAAHRGYREGKASGQKMEERLLLKWDLYWLL